MMLSKGEYLGGLYDIGFDKPETHAIKKGDTLYYAFYADNWKGTITLRGLDSSKAYTINNYVEPGKIADLAPGKNRIETTFKGSLLIEAIPEK